jgi:uncharacterized protein (TIGR01244 family)
MKQLEEQVFVSGQIRPEDVPALKAQGFAMIVNNRPDGEEPGQPTGGEIAAAAAAAGVAYRFAPITQLTLDGIVQMHEALQASGGKTLAFCKSGTRSTFLWALARTRDGADGDRLAEQAAAAGYDLTPIRRFLR